MACNSRVMVGSAIFNDGELPALVFDGAAACAWVRIADLASSSGWDFVSQLAAMHGDSEVLVAPCGVPEPAIARCDVVSGRADYDAATSELWDLSVLRWWGASDRWGIHGELYFDVAVVAQRSFVRWPRIADCALLALDSALRVAYVRRADEARWLEAYDALSWDPATETDGCPELLALCEAVLADAIDPVVAIRRLVDVLDAVPKPVRRSEATRQLHEAWGRTHYLLIGEARAPWGPLLLAQNDQNHAAHAEQERPLVREACAELRTTVARLGRGGRRLPDAITE